MIQFRFEQFSPGRMPHAAKVNILLFADGCGDSSSSWMSQPDIINNVLKFGPHYGLLVAASQLGMDTEPLTALHRTKGKNKAFLQPIEPARDNDGLWTHPDYPAAEEGQLTETNFSQWLHLIGFESRIEAPAYCANCESDISDWEPTAPEGDGWFIGSIHETEDEPYAVCVWLRKLEVA